VQLLAARLPGLRDVPQLRPVFIGVPGSDSSGKQPGGRSQKAGSRARNPGSPGLFSASVKPFLFGRLGEGGRIGPHAAEIVGQCPDSVEGTGKGGDGDAVTGEVRGAGDVGKIAGEGSGKGTGDRLGCGARWPRRGRSWRRGEVAVRVGMAAPSGCGELGRFLSVKSSVLAPGCLAGRAARGSAAGVPSRLEPVP
jgi:hypothetical protein